MTSTTTLRADEIQTDRRRHARIVARGLASHLQSVDASMPGLAVENISEGGMFVRSATALAVGTRVMVQLVRPGLKRAIPSVGCVVSVVPLTQAQRIGAVAGMGIRLDPLELDAARRLRDLVTDLATQPARSPSPLPAPSPAATEDAAPPCRPRRLDTPGKDQEMQDRLVQQLEAEVIVLRREILRRNRTIGELAARLAAHEPEERPARRVDPRAE